MSQPLGNLPSTTWAIPCRCTLVVHGRFWLAWLPFLHMLQELEEDPEMRSKMALYRDPGYNPATDAQLRDTAMTDDDEGDLPEVPLEELLDDLSALHIDEDEE